MRLSTREYKKHKAAIIENLGITETEYTEMIKGDYHEGASRVSSAAVLKALGDMQVSKNFNIRLADSAMLDDWDFVWYYKRNLHVVLPEIESYAYDTSGIDCSCFAEIDKDVDVDTVLPTVTDPKVTYIRLIKRNIPVRFRNSQCDCTIVLTHENGTALRFHIVVSDKVRKVFIENPKSCGMCKACQVIKSIDGYEHRLRPRFRENCITGDVFGDPFGVLSILTNVVIVYLNREKISRQRKETAETKTMRAMMVERNDLDRDTERLMPMFDYVREYHESVKQEWQGGHHASPVSHPRCGYWRKAKHGTHILKDGEFIEVGRGLGNFIYVRATIVNAHKDSTLAEML